MRSAIHEPINFGPMVRGSGVVLAGILCWLYELEHISLMTLLSCWPMALIIIGLSSAVDRGRPERHRGGWGLALAGGLLLAGNQLTPEGHSLEICLAFLPIRVSWPLLLVVIGGYITWYELSRGPVKEQRQCP